jgi:hypothetical protein
VSRSRAVGATLALVAVVAAAWFLLLRTDTVAPRLRVAAAASVIGSGEEAVGVSSSGALLVSLPAPPEGSVPALPLDAPPEGGRLEGTVLEQALVLGAAPVALRPCLAASGYDETGVTVELDSGIELRFGSAARAAQKWRSAAAVLADPSITAADYVDLHTPGRPAVYGEGHSLPPPEGDPGEGCGG